MTTDLPDRLLVTGLAEHLPADVAERLAALAALTKPPSNPVRDELVHAAAENRCQLCMGHLDEPVPGCAGPHVGPARRRRPAQGAHARRRS